jgi:hypothetical protein
VQLTPGGMWALGRLWCAAIRPAGDRPGPHCGRRSHRCAHRQYQLVRVAETLRTDVTFVRYVGQFYALDVAERGGRKAWFPTSFVDNGLRHRPRRRIPIAGNPALVLSFPGTSTKRKG